jgi:flagellar biosynthesis GTPase FlhF
MRQEVFLIATVLLTVIPASGGAQTASDHALAEAHREQARRLIWAVDYRGSIVEFTAAHRLDPRIEDLQDIGRSYEIQSSRDGNSHQALEDKRQAKNAYEHVLKMGPREALRIDIEGRIRNLDLDIARIEAHEREADQRIRKMEEEQSQQREQSEEQLRQMEEKQRQAEAARKRAEERAAREEKKALDAWKQDQDRRWWTKVGLGTLAGGLALTASSLLLLDQASENWEGSGEEVRRLQRVRLVSAGDGTGSERRRICAAWFWYCSDPRRRRDSGSPDSSQYNLCRTSRFAQWDWSDDERRVLT